MVRRLLNAMNSEIHVEDATGGGARFWFDLPIEHEA
jgi:signal transduction histidine kinase